MENFFCMTDYINKPIKADDWDPSKGDYVNKNLIAEDNIYLKKQQKKRRIIIFLALSHILLISLIFILY